MVEEISRVYLLVGESDVLAGEAEASLRQACFSDAAAEAIGYGRWEENELAEAISFLRTVPFFEGRRMARVNLGDEQEGEGRGRTRLLSMLEEALPSLPPWSTLILRHRAPKANQRLAALCRRCGQVVDCQVDRRRLPDWVRARARAVGMTLAPTAAWLLVQICGEDPDLLATELEKISLAVGPGKAVGEPEVREHAFAGREGTFALADAWAKRDLAGALARLARLLAQGHDPVRLLGTLAWQVRSLLYWHYLHAEGVTSSAAVATALETSPAGVKAIGSRARGFQVGELEKALRRLAEVDFRLKTGQAGPDRALEDFLLASLGAGPPSEQATGYPGAASGTPGATPAKGA